MDIKKADSKGRVSGFTPGAYYTVVRGHTGTGFALNQVDTSAQITQLGHEATEQFRVLSEFCRKDPRPGGL